VLGIRITVLMMVMLMASLTARCASHTVSAQSNLFSSVEATFEQSIGTIPPTVSPMVQETMQVTIYHASNDAMYLVPEIHVVPQNDHPAETAIQLLLAGTTNPDLIAVLPPGTILRNLWVKDHVAYVDFTDKLIKNNTGGSTSELLLVGAIVNTLTEFSTIQQVQILVAGEKINTITGHMDTAGPLSRSEKIIKKL